MSTLRAPDEPFSHCTLLHRDTSICEPEKLAIETSLDRSNVTGLYLLEQVQHGRHTMTTATITPAPETVRGLLPSPEQILHEPEEG